MHVLRIGHDRNDGSEVGLTLCPLSRGFSLCKALIKLPRSRNAHSFACPGSYQEMCTIDAAAAYALYDRFFYEHVELPMIMDGTHVLVDCVLFHGGERKIEVANNTKKHDLPARPFVDISLKIFKTLHK